jgi:hypothetical protein
MGDEISYNILDHPYVCNDKEVRFVSLFSNLIHSYGGGETQALYYVENGKPDADNDYLESLARNNNYNYLKIILQIVNDKKYTSGLKNIFETDRYICVDFFGKNLLSQAILWDKKKDVGYYIDEYECYTPNFGHIVYGFDNTLVKIWKNDNIGLLKTNLESGDNSGKYPEDILDILNHYDEEDNPVLLLYTMKNR